MRAPPDSVRIWRRRYRRLLELYPAAYRQHYAGPILQLFDDLLRDAPPGAEHRVIRATIFDTLISIVREQALALKQHFIPKEYQMTKPPFYVRHRLALSIIGGVVVLAAILSAQTIFNATVSAIRLSQINAIYTSLHLSNDYFLVSASVFGDKRVYSYDKGRTQSSVKVYSHEANVDVTVAELRKKIESAGYKFFEEPYPGSAQTELHFKSNDNRYIRLTVSSFSRDSVARSRDMNLLKVYDETHSVNEGPSEVTIKVNLDDNNE